jgi:peptide/nickel transport system permease protein
MEADISQPAIPKIEERVIESDDNLKLEVATQWQLMWWKFRKHRLAVLGGMVVLFFYLVAIFAEFFAPHPTDFYNQKYVYAPPQEINFIREGQLAPYVYGYKFVRDPKSLKPIWSLDQSVIIPIGFLVRGEPYKLLGLIPMDLHLVGPVKRDDPFYLFGADKSGRDIFSRIIHSSRISLSIGLVGVAISTLIGIVLGGLSGLKGGRFDTVIQRLIEIVMSVPTLPILLAIAAFVPISWPVLQVYFILTLMLALTGWTGMARVVRGKFLALREEDFVMAAKLDGAKTRRLIFAHMLPSFYSHIIASLTLALPGMIVGETVLSFLGVGLRPPVVSWGVMLQDAQQVAVIAISPWLLTPAIAIIIVVLAFNFLGDGLRDAADPY